MTTNSEPVVGLMSEDPEERRRATSELAGFDAEGVAEFVAAALADDDWRVRKEAVAVALALAPNPGILERLVAAFLPSENVGLRNAAVEALGGYGEAAVDALSAKLPELDADGRKLAVDALARGGQPSALPELEKLLDDADPNVCIAAAEAIAQIAGRGVGEAIPLLERCVASDNVLVAMSALDGLNALGVVLPWPTIARCLDVPALKRPAILAAGRTADLRAVPVLLEGLASPKLALVLDSVCALRELLRDPTALAEVRERVSGLPGPALAAVTRLAWDDDVREAVRRAAIVVVAAFGVEEAAECAIAAVSDDRLLAEAHEALELLGPRAAQALVRAIREGDSSVRASCLAQLARLEHAPEGALPAVREALEDRSTEVQVEALNVLGRLGDEASLSAVAAFLRPEAPATTCKAAEGSLRQIALRYPEPARKLVASTRADGPEALAACIIFSVLGPAVPGESELTFLSDALSNVWGAVRRTAVLALSEFGGTRGVEPVAFVLADEEPDVRRVAVAALGKIRAPDGSAPGVPRLLELVQHSQDAEVIAAAVRALGDSKDLHAFSVLRPLARSERPHVAVSAVEALAQLTGPRRIDALLDGLSHPDAEVVKATMLALSDTPDARVVAHLGACLDHEAWDVRRLAADLLGRVAGETALGLLRARLAAEDSPPVQAAIARALERAAGIRRSAPPGSLRPR